MTLEQKLEALNKEWTALTAKIKSKLQQKDQTITNTQQQVTNLNNALQEANKKHKTLTDENTLNENILNQLIKEMSELSQSLN